MAKFLTKEQEASIVDSIQQAESETSGEIRVHLEKKCKAETALERAQEVFKELNMEQTELRNGVIVYVAWADKKVAIWGDKGIHQLVGQSFWEEELKLMISHFKEGDFEAGLSEVILQIGHKLKEHFPHQDDDVDELPNEISYNTDTENERNATDDE